jgi:DNA-binding NtrC family response regulator
MPTDKEVAVFLLVSGEKLRDQLLNILQEHHYRPVAMSGPDDLVQALKEYQYATVFLDCEAVSFYGRGIYSKIKVACKSSRVVLLCDKSHLKHRDIIKEAMEIGVYACLLAPFEGWEILAMVRHSQAKKPTKKRIKKRLSS